MRKLVRGSLATLAAALLSAGGARAAENSPVTLLHSFSGSDGARPSGVIFDSNHNLYGTTSQGGSEGVEASCGGGCGTVFSIKADGTGDTVLHQFVGPDGIGPAAGLVLDPAGYLYGTTEFGGNTFCEDGCGTIFRIKTDGTGFEILRPFAGTNGAYSVADLTLDKNGTLYGTATSGGSGTACPGSGCGIVFSLKTDGSGFRILHSFSLTDGATPAGGVILDAGGELYGTTNVGGTSTACPHGCGTVFKIKSDGTGFTVLHSFAPAEGEGPIGDLALDVNDEVCGAAVVGGPSSACQNGCGTIFKIGTDGSGFTNLHSFSSTDGANPVGSLRSRANGNLVGAAGAGGAGTNCQAGCGTVFELKEDGSGFSILDSLSGPPGDGAIPAAGLALDADGNLYLSTDSGGAGTGCSGGCGALLKVAFQGAAAGRADASAIAGTALAEVNRRRQ